MIIKCIRWGERVRRRVWWLRIFAVSLKVNAACSWFKPLLWVLGEIYATTHLPAVTARALRGRSLKCFKKRSQIETSKRGKKKRERQEWCRKDDITAHGGATWRGLGWAAAAPQSSTPHRGGGDERGGEEEEGSRLLTTHHHAYNYCPTWSFWLLMQWKVSPAPMWLLERRPYLFFYLWLCYRVNYLWMTGEEATRDKSFFSYFFFLLLFWFFFCFFRFSLLLLALSALLLLPPVFFSFFLSKKKGMKELLLRNW